MAVDKRNRHYHRLSILDMALGDLGSNGMDAIWSEIYHTHEGGRKGHSHEVELTPAFVKVDRKLR